jgi:hypothetical protein
MKTGDARGAAGDVRAAVYDASHDLVTRDQGQLWMGQFSVHNVEIGSADAAGDELHEYLTGSRDGQRDGPRDEGPARLFEDHGLHGGRYTHKHFLSMKCDEARLPAAS